MKADCIAGRRLGGKNEDTQMDMEVERHNRHEVAF